MHKYIYFPVIDVIFTLIFKICYLRPNYPILNSLDLSLIKGIWGCLFLSAFLITPILGVIDLFYSYEFKHRNKIDDKIKFGWSCVICSTISIFILILTI